MTTIEATRNTVQAAGGEITTVDAVTTRVYGRFIVNANGKHFVSDTRASIGGPGEAVQAGELLLSALASCGLGLIQTHARGQGIELGEVAIAAAFKRHPDDPTRYDYIRLAVAFEERISQQTADACIRHFTDNCPIYNTLRRGGPISIERNRGSSGRTTE
ncbi:MAG: OsmC family protein [Bradyrhizobium sp.]